MLGPVPGSVSSSRSERTFTQGSGKELRFTENLPPGSYLVLAKERTELRGRSAELCAWRQHGGKDADWETAAMTPLQPGRWQTLAKIRKVDLKSDGLNVFFRFGGFQKGEEASVGGMRIIQLDAGASDE